MIRITKVTDYGFVLLTRMIRSDEEFHNARAVSEATHIPLPMVSKILKSLTRSGLLDSQRGVKGGYTLARPANEISVIEIIDALEGPVAITECSCEPVSKCELESLCPVSTSWNKINIAVRGALEGITLAEIAKPIFPFTALNTKTQEAAKEPQTV
jgi:FeS assembly SUF system regulator